jgi:glycosyltransferase involved in cell wall biosynthesis
MKASHGHRFMHRYRMRALRQRAVELRINVRFVEGDWPHDRVLGLISACTCYVSLHRAEGFGYTCAEAMFYERPVIATNYSGNLDFMDAENSLLVDFKEVEVSTPDGPFQRGSVWAEPCIEHAAALMAEVVANPTRARQLGTAARASVTSVLSAEHIGRRVREALTAGR